MSRNKSVIRETHGFKIKFGHTCKASDIRQWLERVPDDADVCLWISKGDTRESTESTITATYTVEAKG